MKSFVLWPVPALFVLVLFVAPLAAYQDEPPRRIGDGVSAPIPIVKPEPKFPADAEGEEIGGPVLLRLVVDESGMPTGIEVRRSLDPRFDREAVEALKKWRFKPGMKNGKAVAVQVTVEITFRRP
jgi:protein TonB